MPDLVDWCSDLEADNDEEAPGCFNEDFESECYGKDDEED